MLLSRSTLFRNILCKRHFSAKEIYNEDRKQFIELLKASKQSDIFKGCNVTGRVVQVNLEENYAKRYLIVDWGHKFPAHVVVDPKLQVDKGDWIVAKLLTPELAMCESGKKKWTSLNQSSLEFVSMLSGSSSGQLTMDPNSTLPENLEPDSHDLESNSQNLEPNSQNLKFTLQNVPNKKKKKKKKKRREEKQIIFKKPNSQQLDSTSTKPMPHTLKPNSQKLQFTLDNVPNKKKRREGKWIKFNDKKPNSQELNSASTKPMPQNLEPNSQKLEPNSQKLEPKQNKEDNKKPES